MVFTSSVFRTVVADILHALLCSVWYGHSTFCVVFFFFFFLGGGSAILTELYLRLSAPRVKTSAWTFPCLYPQRAQKAISFAELLLALLQRGAFVVFDAVSHHSGLSCGLAGAPSSSVLRFLQRSVCVYRDNQTQTRVVLRIMPAGTSHVPPPPPATNSYSCHDVDVSITISWLSCNLRRCAGERNEYVRGHSCLCSEALAVSSFD